MSGIVQADLSGPPPPPANPSKIFGVNPPFGLLVTNDPLLLFSKKSSQPFPKFSDPLPLR